MHRAPDRRSLAAGLAIAIALLAAGGGQSAQAPVAPEDGAAAWRGFVDSDRAAIAVGQRMIVVLKNPSLADRIAEAGGTATESAMRQWTAGALAAQKQIAARLSREGIQLVPDFVYTRTFNGFAAAIDGRALALLERDEDVFGVYPVRAAYPAALSAAELHEPALRVRKRPPRRGRASRASTGVGSPSRSSTPASTSRIRSSATGCWTGSTCSIPSGEGSPARTPTSRPGSSGTARRWPG